MNTVYAAPRPGLPRAIEELPREERILWSMVRVFAEKGPESATVLEVTKRAGVPRHAFYELFESKEDCLVAAYERVIDALVAYVRGAFEGHGSWPQKLRRSLKALLETFSDEPEVARIATVEIPTARPEARRRYRAARGRLESLFREGRGYAPADASLPDDLEMMAVGGTEAVIAGEVAAGRTKRLPALLPDLLFTALVPYVGPEAATAEVRRTEEG